MLDQSITFQQFLPASATDEEYNRYIDLFESEFREINVNQTMPARIDVRRSLENMNADPHFEVDVYMAQSADKVVGRLILMTTKPISPNYETQKHIGNLNMYILPDFRRRGIGREMLHFVFERCREHGMTIMEGGTSFASGQAFAQHFRMQVASENIYSQVDLDTIDWQLMTRWREEGQARNPDTRLVHFEGLYSDDEAELQQYAAFLSVLQKDIPTGDLEAVVTDTTTEQIRQAAATERKNGVLSQYMLIVESDERISGITRIGYNLDGIEHAGQGLTGVLASERGRGLGKWLKAAMLFYVKTAYPHITNITTSNATMNAPMLSINERIGFKVYKRRVFYKFHIANVVDKLDTI